MLKSVIKRLMTIGPKLDLTPVPQLLRSAGPAKSYHFGGTFPHTRSGQQGTDPLGRPAGWSNIHLIDASVLPTVPSTTFTLSVMANAHRIVSGSRRG